MDVNCGSWIIWDWGFFLIAQSHGPSPQTTLIRRGHHPSQRYAIMTFFSWSMHNVQENGFYMFLQVEVKISIYLRWSVTRA